MSTAAVPDKKGIVSSLSADAAEFVPLAAPIPDGATVKGEVISGKGEAPSSVQIRDVPQFLTSCFPFVQLDGDLRTDIGNRFPLPMQYTGIPQTVPMPNPAPVRLPPWPNIRPGLIGSFPTQAAFGSLPYMDTIATAVSVSQERSQGEGLLPAPVGLPLPGLHNTPGLILAAQPGHISTPPWLLTSAPPPVPPPQHSVFLLSQQQHRSLTSVPSTTLTTVSASAGSISSIAASKCQTSEATTLASVKQRAISPVLISRSAQTYFPKQIHNLTLKEKPHPLYIRSHGKHKSDKQKASNDQEQDSDSGYNSPLQAKKLISCGTQVFTTVLSPRSDNNLAVEVRSTSSAKSAVAAVIEKGHGKTSATEDSVGDARKKAKKKKDQRPLSVRSPHALGSSSKLLSRSSSSISSAGTRPEEDDEKIDLHSWTDFPPMVPKSGGGVAGRPALSPSLGPSGHGEGQADRVALTIERTAHAPPWTIKYTVDSSNSSRSSSGEKEKCGGVVTSAGTMGTHPENIFVHPKNVRGVKHSKESTGSGKEVSKLIQGNNLGTLPPAAAVHKPNTTCVTATTLNTSPVASTVMTTISKTLNTSLVTTSQANKGVPYSQVIKMPVTQTGLSNPINSMTFSPVNAVHSPSLSSAFPGPSLSGSNQPALSVPPPPLLLSAPCANQQTCAGGRPPLPMAFSGPPPPFTHPPPPPHTPLHSFPGIPIPHLYHLPPPPAPVLGQHHQAVRPAYPSQPVPGLHHQTPPGVPAPASLAGPMPVATSRSTPVSSKQEGTQSSLDPTGRQIRAGSILPSQDSVIQSNIGMKNTLTLHAQVPRPPHAAMASKKSTPAAVASLNPPGEGPVSSALAPIVADGMDGEDKKRRRRRRRRGRGQGLGGSEGLTREGSPGLEHAISSSNVSESTLHFEDVDEFPDLVAGNRGYLPGEECGGADRATLSGTSLSYSDVIKATWSKASSQSRTQSLTGSCVSGDDEDNASNHTGTSNLSKRARKRRRRREQANKAAEVELAEISLEQQWLQQVGLRKSPTNAPPRGGLITNPATVGEAKVQAAGKAAAGGKKFHQPIAFDIAAMIDAIQKKPAAQAVQPGVGKSGLGGASSKSRRKDCKESTGNVLDSTAPLQKRGKEREIPRAKKPSPLKKVILKEREQRKRLRLLDGDPDTASGISGSKSGGVGIIGGESELSQEALSSKSEGTDEGEVGVTAELSADLSPISQTSPISMSPASPGNSGVSSPSAGSIGRDPVIMKIHSRRFREYCTQILDKEIDQCCTSLLQELVKFQDRMYHKNPVKAKSKRRVVLGLREVTKHLKLKRIKCVVISPNLEKIQSKGGLDEALNTILTMCQEQNVPFVFALGRRALGRACAKLVPVSVVGIFNYEGCESKYHSLISLTAAARDAYHEMVQAVEREVAEHPASQASSSIGGVPGLFAAHMGHSRTPSGCSAISFTSSILSEPISENFPHAEPEVDSKGYEIVRDAAGNVVHSQEGTSKRRSPNDIDDGNEADVEDLGEMRRKKRPGKNLNSVRFGSVGSSANREGSDEYEKSKSNTSTKQGNDTARESSDVVGNAEAQVIKATLTQNYSEDIRGVVHDPPASGASGDSRVKTGGSDIGSRHIIDGVAMGSPVSHIDSIHSRSYNLGEAILSQHTSLPSAEAVSGPGSSQTLPHSPRSACNEGLQNTGGTYKDISDNDIVDDDDNDIEDDLRISAVDDDSSDENYEDEDDEEDNDDNDNNEDNDDDEENEEVTGPVLSHQRIIDKERIKSWLESQTTVVPED